MTLAIRNYQQPTQQCEHCDAPASLYSLTHGRRGGDGRMLAVCRFCYIRLSGLKPNRGQLIEQSPAGR